MAINVMRRKTPTSAAAVADPQCHIDRNFPHAFRSALIFTTRHLSTPPHTLSMSFAVLPSVCIRLPIVTGTGTWLAGGADIWARTSYDPTRRNS
jgi:hypothetical protein